jgi:DNA-directed RNA polymerase specialized sigma24 family protein
MQGSTSKALELIARHHKEYINTVKSLYGNNFEVINYAEDFVQDAYIKLSRYDNLYDKAIKPDGSVSKGYIFFCLRSVVLNKLGLKKVAKYNHLGDRYDLEEKYDVVDTGRDPVEEAVEKLEARMFEVVEENSEWFDAMLFKTYIETGKSFRVLASETGLGIQTIYLSIKASKLIIAEQLLEDYTDLVNGDLHLIK